MSNKETKISNLDLNKVVIAGAASIVVGASLAILPASEVIDKQASEVVQHVMHILDKKSCE